LGDRLDAVDHVGHLIELHGPAIPVRHDNLPEFVRIVQLSIRNDVVRLFRPEQLSCRLGHVPVLESGTDLVDADLLGFQFVWIHLNAHGVPGRALHVDLRDAADGRDARRQNIFRVGIDGRHVERVRRQVDRQNRLIGRVHLAERGRCDERGRQQRHGGGDGGLNVDCRAVDVAVQIECQRDVAAARVAGRGHFIDAGNRGELPLEWTGHCRRHGVRIAARQIGADADRRIVDSREIADRQGPIGDDAEERDPSHQEARRDWAVDERL
jgi:hypothetical protein